MTWVEKLKEHWEDILEEYLKIHGATPYFERDLYTGDWDVFPFLFFDQVFQDGIKLCPKTWELLKDIPGLVNASFSILKPGTEIAPHTGFTDQVYRYHLGIKIPDDCGMIVNKKLISWEPGQLLLFDDTQEHSAYNRSDEERVVLLFDVERGKEMHLGTCSLLD
jgi:beta-hydroxylase